MARSAASSAAPYRIRFEPLSARAHALEFGCDAEGRVEIDALDDRDRNDYFFARALVGRDFARPAFVCAAA